ncbi:hypothetical protein HY024_01280 [Candidatus Curtissbacteria bacterium]|nr:hypothetical protein [Candidatus Curtissbacteria bacterium]
MLKDALIPNPEIVPKTQNGHNGGEIPPQRPVAMGTPDDNRPRMTIGEFLQRHGIGEYSLKQVDGTTLPTFTPTRNNN